MNPETTQPPPVLGAPSTASYTLRDLLLYFLRLGTLGFGGPIALAGHMQKDLVEERRWVSKQDYLEGLAFSQLSPGPLAAQLAMYLGWVRAGALGATLVGIAFILPSFLMALVLAALYVHFGSLPWIQGMFYGIGAAVIAIIVRSAIKLVRSSAKQYWRSLRPRFPRPSPARSKTSRASFCPTDFGDATRSRRDRAHA